MKVIFMGTPQFSLFALEKLIHSKHKVVAVYTRAPKKAGRGQKTQLAPVHEMALKSGLKIFTPKSLRNSETQKEMEALKADVIVVSAYGLILPKEVLETPKYGCINIHPSLLPRWRGASPIQSALLAGDKKTGVCIVKMGEGLDDGDILKCEEIAINETADIEFLHDELGEMGAELLLQTLDEIEATGKVEGQKQDNSKATYAKKIEKTAGKIDWTKSADEIDRQIRALWAFPGVYFDYKGERIKILKAEKVVGDFGKPGQVIDEALTISCGKDAIRPLMLQRPGKKALKTEEFLRGFKSRNQ